MAQQQEVERPQKRKKKETKKLEFEAGKVLSKDKDSLTVSPPSGRSMIVYLSGSMATSQRAA